MIIVERFLKANNIEVIGSLPAGESNAAECGCMSVPGTKPTKSPDRHNVRK